VDYTRRLRRHGARVNCCCGGSENVPGCKLDLHLHRLPVAARSVKYYWKWVPSYPWEVWC